MSVSNGLITAPLSIEDVRRTLGAASTDLGTLCTHVNVKKWCKNKPVRYTTPQQLTDAQKKSVSYGMVAPSERNTAAATKTDTWGYNKPRGSAYSEYYRLTDFDHYFHNCVPPCNAANGDVVFNSVLHTSIVLKTFEGIISPYNITIADLTKLANYYLCLVFTKPDGTILFKTLDTTFGANPDATSPSITVTSADAIGASNDTVWDYYLCAFSAKKTGLYDVAVLGTYLALPCASTSDLSGTFTFKKELPITFVITKISPSNNVTSSQMMNSAESFVGQMPEGGGDLYYFNTGTTYTCSIQCTLTNTANYDVTLNLASLSFRLSNNLVSTSEVGTFNFKSMKNTSFTSISSVDIKTGQSVEVILALPDDVFRSTGPGTVITQPSTGQRISVRIKVGYNSYNNIKDFASILRIRNTE